MKISCQSCQAKYTIADEKVLGKIVKIRCKKCGATIVINGNEPDAMTAGGAPQPAAAYDYAAQQGGEPWTVNVSDGDQRSMTLSELVAAFQSGTVNDETYCWKDGMADWLPIREIPELQAACSGGAPQAAAPPAQGGYEQHPPPEEATQAGFSSLFGGQQQQQPQNGSAALFGGAEAPAPVATTAARRAGGRGGGGADLFGSVAQAGGEQDVMTSASGNPRAPVDDKLTGARNENSVLFSLAALTSSAPEKKDPIQSPGTEGSGLIDIRALSASMEQKKDGGKKVDDIMNLSGGGAFSAALAAPVLAPPMADASDYGAPGEGGKKSNTTLLLGIIGGFVIVGVLVAGGVFLALSKSGGSQSTAASATAASSTAAPTTSVAENDTANAGGAGQTDPNGAVKPGVGASGGGAAVVHQGGAVAHTGGGTTGGAATTGGGGNGGLVDPPPPHTGGGSKCAPGDLQCAMAAGAGVPATGGGTTGGGGGGATAPFDRSAAASSLGGIASGLGSCKRGDGPSGQGHAKITFAPSGNVSSVEIDGGPFPGTAVGGCVAGKLRGAHVPAFAGGAITVGKSFNI